MKDKAISFFESHPSKEECFITSDGFVFIENQAANSYASSLKDKKVLHFTKQDEEPIKEEFLEEEKLEIDPEAKEHEEEEVVVVPIEVIAPAVEQKKQNGKKNN